MNEDNLSFTNAYADDWEPLTVGFTNRTGIAVHSVEVTGSSGNPIDVVSVQPQASTITMQASDTVEEEGKQTSLTAVFKDISGSTIGSVDFSAEIMKTVRFTLTTAADEVSDSVYEDEYAGLAIPKIKELASGQGFNGSQADIISNLAGTQMQGKGSEVKAGVKGSINVPPGQNESVHLDITGTVELTIASGTASATIRGSQSAVFRSGDNNDSSSTAVSGHFEAFLSNQLTLTLDAGFQFHSQDPAGSGEATLDTNISVGAQISF